MSMLDNIRGYEIKSILGKGGMATVYLAENPKFGVQVAVKVLNREYVHIGNIRERFFSEAKLLYRMSHPNIVKATDLIDEGETAAYVMDYVEGETLKSFLDRKGALNDEEVKFLFSQMLEAVDFVHENQLVHRDIKPSNFMVGKGGRVKLMDFGIVKNLDPTAPEYTMTGTTQQMGTPMYMSPEQVKSSKSVNARSDIYSLGVVLWQMVSGRRPYDSDTLSTFDIQLKIVTEPLESTNTGWDRLIEKATRKDPEARFESCVGFREVLNSGSSFGVSPDVKESAVATIVGDPGKSDRTVIDNSIPTEILLEGSVLDGNGTLKYGKVDIKGNWVIQPMFDRLDDFNDQGYCRAESNGKYGFIDRRGNWVIQPMFDNLFDFDNHGYCEAASNGKYGFIDRRGNWVIQPQFDMLGGFDGQGYCRAESNGKHGFIDRRGNWVIQPMFDTLNWFDDQEYCMATSNGKYGFIDRRSNWVIQPMFDHLEDYDDQGYCRAESNGKYGFIDRRGNWIIKPMFDEVREFNRKGYCIVSIKEKYGIIDRKGIWLIQPLFEEIESNDESDDAYEYFKVSVNDKTGIIDKSGNWIFEPISGAFGDYDSQNYCKVYFNGKNGYIDREGSWIIQPIYDILTSYDDQGYCLAKSNKKWGFIDRKGNWIIQPMFDCPNKFEISNYCIIELNEKKGIINRMGDWIIEPAWICKICANNIFQVSKGKKYGYKDIANAWVIPPVFDYILMDVKGNPMAWNQELDKWEVIPSVPPPTTLQSLQDFFGNLTKSNKLYLGDNIPDKKLKNMLKHVKPDFSNEANALVYYDDTILGKGDDGYAILEKDAHRYLFVSVYRRDKALLCLSDDGGYHVTESAYTEKNGLCVKAFRTRDKSEKTYIFGLKNEYGQALSRYLSSVVSG
jgi:serine/threonine protein kinase